RHQHDVCGGIESKHAVRPELTDDRAAAETPNHEQPEANHPQPLGGLQTCHAWVVFENVIDTEAENSSLCRDIEKLRAHAKGEVFTSEQIPASCDQHERREVCDHQKAVLHRWKKCFVHVEHRPQ